VGPVIFTFTLLYLSYALSLTIKRNFAFWQQDLVAEGFAAVGTEGSVGAVYEFANGVSKVAGAVLVDLLSPSLVLSASLGVQGLCCVLFLVALRVGKGLAFSLARCVWGLNGFAQAFAWPAMTRVFLAWFPPEARGLWYGVLGTSQNLGAAAAPYLTGWAARAHGWRARLLVPGALTLLFALLLWVLLTDAPQKRAEQTQSRSQQPQQQQVAPPAGGGEGAPPPAGGGGRGPSPARQRRNSAASSGPALLSPSVPLSTPAPAPPPATTPTAASALRGVLLSRPQQLLAAHYFFNTLVRNGLTTFIRAYLVAELRLPEASAALGNFWYEMGGTAGGLLSGWLSDACCGAARGPVMAAFGAALVPLPLLLPLLRDAPQGVQAPAVAVLYAALGLAAFPPHVLNGLMSRELAPPGAQSTAGGFTKAAGQLGASVADALLPAVAQRAGWRAVLAGLAASAAASAACVLPLLREKAAGAAGAAAGGKEK
jgi:OPA family sugar phosphate sensor protein UhpC-like MFS transporter